MSVLAVSLPFVGHAVWVREHSGADEQVVDGIGTPAALALLDRLLVARAGAFAGPGQAARLTTADRDQVLAAVCSATFGDRVEATRHCEHCGQRFDLDFRISELSRALRSERGAPAADGTYTLENGVRFRLPTGEDELAVAGFPSALAERRLLERCVLSGDVERDGARVSAAMSEVAPTLDLDLDAACSECGAETQVHFSMQAWLLGQLLNEQARLPRQVHVLARAYGWSLSEILSLSRRQRLAFVALVEEERRVAQRSRS